MSQAAQRIEMKEMSDGTKAVRAREEIGTVVAQLYLIDDERDRGTNISTPRGTRRSNTLHANYSHCRSAGTRNGLSIDSRRMIGEKVCG